MTIIETTDLSSSQKQAILLLWNTEYPETLNYPDLAHLDNYLSGLAGKTHYLLADDTNNVLGWAFTFTRDEEKWFGILLDKSILQQGYGTKLLNRIKEKETVLIGWVMDHSNAIKSNGDRYKSPLDFYAKNNFVVSGTRLETEKMSAVKIVWKKE